MGGYASCPPSGGQGHSDTTGGIPNGLYHLMFMHSLVQQKRAPDKQLPDAPDAFHDSCAYSTRSMS
jgi:hypothetical protein